MEQASTEGLNKTEAVAKTETEQEKVLNFEFKGVGFEYFKIWIVNVLLTILSLGIYSAWAKVRNNRYFYSNLYLDGHHFSYLANPWMILRGRILAVIVLVAYSALSNFFPIVGAVLAIILMLVFPFIINSSLAFSRRVSSYRNIQFRFKGTYGGAAMAFLVWPILGVLSIFILYPLAIKKGHEYIVKNSSYGTSEFDYHASAWDYAKIFGFILLGMIVYAVLIAALSFAGLVNLEAGEPDPMSFAIQMVPTMVLYLGIFVYASVAIVNLFYRNITLVQHELDADLEYIPYLKVLLVNLGLTIITLGLYLPAAKVRMTKYLTSRMSVVAVGDLDNFVAAEQDKTNALGEELGQAFDLDLGV